jgi:NAD(P)-dependent dehydrogenase (short-subunit alcohol dehydrogenase family)
MPTILITGTNRGIGLELTKQYLNEGWRVFACSRHAHESNELNALKKQYAHLLTLASLDVRDEKRIQSLATEWQSESIDILFNNAGIYGPEHVQLGSLNAKDWEEVLLINSISPLLVAQAFVEHVAKSQKKIIATMSSLMGSIADNTSGQFYYYRSSKAAVNAAMKSLAIDLQNQKITSVVFHPGWVQTDMGGPNAPLPVSESVAGIRRVLSQLTLADNGKFLSYQGNELLW